MRPNNKPWTREHPDNPPYRAPRADAGLGELPGEKPVPPCVAHDNETANAEALSEMRTASHLIASYATEKELKRIHRDFSRWVNANPGASAYAAITNFYQIVYKHT